MADAVLLVQDEFVGRAPLAAGIANRVALGWDGFREQNDIQFGHGGVGGDVGHRPVKPPFLHVFPVVHRAETRESRDDRAKQHGNGHSND